MRPLLALSALLLTITLGACGTRGPLTLPPAQAHAFHPAAMAKTDLASADLNTVKAPA